MPHALPPPSDSPRGRTTDATVRARFCVFEREAPLHSVASWRINFLAFGDHHEQTETRPKTCGDREGTASCYSRRFSLCSR